VYSLKEEENKSFCSEEREREKEREGKIDN